MECGAKGQSVNIPILSLYAWRHKVALRRFGLCEHGYPVVGIDAGLGSTVMVRTRATSRIVPQGISRMPGALEKRRGKDQRYSYPEPALVPLGEKPQV